METTESKFFSEIENGDYFDEQTGEKYDLTLMNQMELVTLFHQWLQDKIYPSEPDMSNQV